MLSARPSPGRMAPSSAFNFLLMGLAGMLAAKGHAAMQAPQALALTSFLTGLLGLVGYVYGEISFYGIDSYTQMAAHTAIAFVFYAVGMLFLHPDRGWMHAVSSPYAGGLMARRLILKASIFPLASVGSFCKDIDGSFTPQK